MLYWLNKSTKRFHAVLLIGTFSGFLGLISRTSVVDLDLFHEMALFREALQLGRLPDHDLYSYIPTVFPVIHHEWGTGAFIYLLTVKLGLGGFGLMTLKFFLTFFIVINCYRFALQQGSDNFIYVYCAFFSVVLGWIGFTTIRAQLFTLCLLLVLLFIIERDRKNETWTLWWLVPLFILWINLHGGFVVGIGLVVLYILERFIIHWLNGNNFYKSLYEVKKHLLVLLVICIGLQVNPYGSDYFPYLWEAITLDRTDLIKEWRPLWTLPPLTFLVYCGAVLLTILPFWYKRYIEVPGLVLVMVTAIAGLLHFRHLSLFALLFLCYVPAYLRGTPVGYAIRNIFSENSNILTMLYIVVTILFGGYSVSNQFWKLKVPTDMASHEKSLWVYPVGAVNYLKEQNFTGNLMTPYNMGAYVSWKMYPKVKVSMDSRFEVAYTYEAVVENGLFYEGVSFWYEISKRYNTDGLLVPNWSKVKQIIDEEPKSWKLIYSDGAYSVYMAKNIAMNYPVTQLGNKTSIGTFP
ncbi:MAG: hypothetical protein OEM02_00795 [Desulfobulbaceae bacterium]|nr:hypothetical protein [Desulfobulbaceae bacterium]